MSAVSLPTEAYKGQEFGLERMCESIRLAVSKAGLHLEKIAAVGDRRSAGRRLARAVADGDATQGVAVSGEWVIGP